MQTSASFSTEKGKSLLIPFFMIIMYSCFFYFTTMAVMYLEVNKPDLSSPYALVESHDYLILFIIIGFIWTTFYMQAFSYFFISSLTSI